MNGLYLKHRVVVSPAGPLVFRLRHALAGLNTLRHPELALLREEDVMMRALLARTLKPDDVCVDVGAHIGSVSRQFRQNAPQGRHVLVEASPSKAAWLRRAFTGFEIHQVAVSDREGQVSFFENLDRPGFSSLRDRSNRGRSREIVAQCTTLDRLLAGRERIDFIKIDVEGFEYSVLKGARATLERCRPVVLFEAGAATDPDIDNTTYVALFDLLTKELAYDIRPVFGDHFGKPPITQADFMTYRTYPFMAFNYVARPRPTEGGS